jgi:hypothetical protein
MTSGRCYLYAPSMIIVDGKYVSWILLTWIYIKRQYTNQLIIKVSY